MLFRPAYFYNRNNIVPLLGRRVRSLGLESHTVEVDDGQNMEWEKLLLAVGGMPIVPTVEGMDKRGIFTFTTLDQAKEIDKFLGNAHKAVVIGGGLIGVSATEALAKRGVEVVIVEMKDRILPTILDERASSIVEEVLDGEGIRVIAGQTVTQVVGAAQVSGVVLGSGERIPCELVVVAIGVSPRIELTLGTDIKVRSYACTEAARCQSDCPNPPAHDAFTRLARV
jgi:NAD(P)H-nitrite reductase large subunit